MIFVKPKKKENHFKYVVDKNQTFFFLGNFVTYKRLIIVGAWLVYSFTRVSASPPQISNTICAFAYIRDYLSQSKSNERRTRVYVYIIAVTNKWDFFFTSIPPAIDRAECFA